MHARLFTLYTLLCAFLFSSYAYSEQDKKEAIEYITTDTLTLRGTPKYQPGFTHWDYANPDAPKGGEMKFGQRGTFDNFNRYADRGSAPKGIGTLFDTLFVANEDEKDVYYGLIAEKAKYASDFTTITFFVNPKATFQDGSPIKASDIHFSFNKFMTQGVVQFRRFYEGTSSKVIDDMTVEFTFAKEPNKAKMLSILALKVFPESYYKDKNLKEPFKEPPLGSGPYKVGDYKMGQYIVYERVKDYWADDHPTRKGLYNFDTLRYEYYLDEVVQLEAFKKGEYEVREENIAKNWMTQYNGKNFDAGYIIKEEIEHSIPSASNSYIFNIKRPQFSDARVREAIALMFDFEWTNKNFFYGGYERNTTYFINSHYAASGTPKGKELEILKEFEKELPSELFTKEFVINKTDASGKLRKERRKALSLLKQAGYSLKDGKLVDTSGKQLEFEIIFYNASSERIAIPFQKNLEKIGVKMNIRLLTDTSQYINRVRDRDFDMVNFTLGGWPDDGLLLEWHSDYLDSTYNLVGTTDPTIDSIVKGIVKNLENEEELVHYTSALDRIALWRHYSIPLWHLSKHRIAYWDKFSRPSTPAKYGLAQEAWWFDKEKAKKLDQTN